MEDERQEILDYLNSIRDPRKDKNKKHKLIDMLVLTICGVICDADDWVKLEHFARCKEEWFKTFLELPNGIPSHDTFGRLFARLCPDEFRKCFLDWINGVAKLAKQEVIAIDGKTLRRVMTGAMEQPPFKWSAPGQAKTSWCWAKWKRTASPMKSGRSPSYCKSWL